MKDIFGNELTYGDVIITPLKENYIHLKFAFNMFVRDLGDGKYLAVRLLSDTTNCGPLLTYRVEAIRQMGSIQLPYVNSYRHCRKKHKKRYGTKNE
jgi:hypothetical protein